MKNNTIDNQQVETPSFFAVLKMGFVGILLAASGSAEAAKIPRRVKEEDIPRALQKRMDGFLNEFMNSMDIYDWYAQKDNGGKFGEDKFNDFLNKYGDEELRSGFRKLEELEGKLSGNIEFEVESGDSAKFNYQANAENSRNEKPGNSRG